jgi:hypothetical protein
MCFPELLIYAYHLSIAGIRVVAHVSERPQRCGGPLRLFFDLVRPLRNTLQTNGLLITGRDTSPNGLHAEVPFAPAHFGRVGYTEAIQKRVRGDRGATVTQPPGSAPQIRPISGEIVNAPDATSRCQLPVWLSLCASSTHSSLLRSFFSASLRSVMSVTAPTISNGPDSSPEGRPTHRKYLTDPSGISSRFSKSNSVLSRETRSMSCSTTDLSSG